MFRSRPSLGFPRKIVAYYMLFCMVAVSWLSVGVLVTSHTILNSRTTSASLSRLGKTARAIEIEYLRHGPEKFQAILNCTQSESGQAYSSVISLEGKYLAHTQPDFVGKRAVEPTGTLLCGGNVTGIRHVDQANQIVNEYRSTLVANGETIGSLQIAVKEPSLWTTLSETAQIAPLAIFVPLGLVAIGAVVLSRLSRPMADVDAKLRSIAMLPPGAEVLLPPLPARDAISLGWNRAAEALGNLKKQSGNGNLNSRLTDALAAQKQNEMQDILQNLSDGIAVTDAEGRITFANRAIAALLDECENGASENGELEDRLIKDLPALANCKLFDQEAIQRLMVAEIEPESEQSARTLRVARQPLSSQRLRGHVWSVRDVTQQKLASAMRDQFIDAATHELRTPLSNIKAYAETLATCESIEVEQQKEFCNIINSEVTRLARFVDDLLSISSMEAGSLSIERQNVKTERLFEEVVSKIQPLMDQKDISLEVVLPEKIRDLRLDKDKIVAVLVNLIGNAAKYSPSGGQVFLKMILDQEQLQVSVEDTGLGIDPKELPKVFDKFFRSEDPRVRAEAGTGLGLSLAREVVRMHGGEITVDSVPDEGSTFTVSIPLE